MRWLLVVDPHRFDFYRILEQLPPGQQFILLWAESRHPGLAAPEGTPITFSEVWAWEDFASPGQVLERLRPDKIIFWEIIDLRQIALIVEATGRGLPTFYLEHGAAGHAETARSRYAVESRLGTKLRYLFQRLSTRLIHVLRSKLFYYRVSPRFDGLRSALFYYWLPVAMMGGSCNQVLSGMPFRERVPRWCIVFSPVNFGEFRLYTHAVPEQAVFSGVPSLDGFYQPALTVQENLLVYIDHPYLEEGILDWTPAHHEKLAHRLNEFAAERGLRLVVKLHPRSNLALWQSYGLKHVEIYQQGDYTSLYLQASLVLSYSSSLVTGLLCARKNVVLLGWHPVPRIFGHDFAESGLCRKSLKPDEMALHFDQWRTHNLAANGPGYEKFLEQNNPGFDGRAGERVVAALLDCA